MNKGLIITLPRHEYTVDYLAVFSKSIVEAANKRDIKVKELKGKNTNKENFASFLYSLDYKMIVFNGHGSEDTISGHKDRPIIQAGANEYLLRERITYARSCWAGCVLGKECMKNNKEGCFIGYKLPFMFYIDDRWRSNPHKDSVAPLFLEPANLIPISLIKGNTALHAHENSKKHILKAIKKVLGEGTEEAFLFAEKLWNNYVGQVLIGNESATL
ncbi:MAG: hypothetical protein AB1668_02835 [Nanoarchaeota archaeon]